MTSEERRAARRKRRDAKRAHNRCERLATCNLDSVAEVDNLYKSANDAAKGVRWKSSVQRYMNHVLPNVIKARSELLSGTDFRRPVVTFDICERGKLRHITSVKFSERVIQKAIAQYALAPAIWPTMTAGCSANIPGRGTDYAIKRLKQQLVEHYRFHGRDGYILLVDFAGYFASLDHKTCKKLVRASVDDVRILRVVDLLIDESAGEHGLGLGSEPNQTLAVALPAPIDRMALNEPAITASGRYMDDSYFIAQSKDDLWRFLKDVEQTATSLGLTINRKKTKVIKLSRGFEWLHKRFSYGENGKVVVRPCKASITRERRRLKKMAHMVERGIMSQEDVSRSYQSWRGYMRHLEAHNTLVRMDALYKDLFSK